MSTTRLWSTWRTLGLLLQRDRALGDLGCFYKLVFWLMDIGGTSNGFSLQSWGDWGCWSRGGLPQVTIHLPQDFSILCERSLLLRAPRCAWMFQCDKIQDLERPGYVCKEAVAYVTIYLLRSFQPSHFLASSANLHAREVWFDGESMKIIISRFFTVHFCDQCMSGCICSFVEFLPPWRRFRRSADKAGASRGYYGMHTTNHSRVLIRCTNPRLECWGILE